MLIYPVLDPGTVSGLSLGPSLILGLGPGIGSGLVFEISMKNSLNFVFWKTT